MKLEHFCRDGGQGIGVLNGDRPADASPANRFRCSLEADPNVLYATPLWMRAADVCEREASGILRNPEIQQCALNLPPDEAAP
jgi:hypothetical protein